MKTGNFQERLGAAMSFALQIHGKDLRKDGRTPYMCHLSGVAEIVARHGGTDDEIVAAFLHDTVEDHPDQVTLELLTEKFGQGVSDIVKMCTDTPKDYAGGPKPDWIIRKREHIQKVAGIPHGTPGRVVLAADKLHNTLSIAADRQKTVNPAGIWGKLKGGLSGTAWYVNSMTNALGNNASAAEDRVLAELGEALEAAIAPHPLQTLLAAEESRQLAAGHPPFEV
jgi:hypothetical protein